MGVEALRTAADELGMTYSKEWVSALDDRVRDDHQEAHGQTVGIDEEFEVGGARGIERLHLHLHGIEATSEVILNDWRRAEPNAAQTVDLWAAILAPPLAMILNTVGASLVPVGGGLANVPELIARLDAQVRGMILRAGDAPLIVPAKSGVEPGLIGAAAAGEAAFG